MTDLAARFRARRLKQAANAGTMKRPPVQAYPYGIERDYVRALLDYMADVHSATLSAFNEGAGVTLDAEAPRSPTLVVSKIAEVRVSVMGTLPRGQSRAKQGKKVNFLASQELADISKRVDSFNKAAIGDQLKAAIGINPLAQGAAPVAEATFKEWIAENVALIKTIPERYFSEVEALVADGMLAGKTNDQLRAAIVERFNVSKSNAKRIAVDQTGKLNGKLTELRQRGLGVSRYTWRTTRDERVRKAHIDLEGRVFEWNAPPMEGHPGQPIRCRCRPEPMLSDLLVGL